MLKYNGTPWTDNREIWVVNLGLPFSWVTLGKLLPHSEPQSSHVSTRDDNSSYFKQLLWGLNEIPMNDVWYEAWHIIMQINVIQYLYHKIAFYLTCFTRLLRRFKKSTWWESFVTCKVLCKRKVVVCFPFPQVDIAYPNFQARAPRKG